jgi:hypothetical protein
MRYIFSFNPEPAATAHLVTLLPIAHNFSRGSPLVFGVVGARILVPRC